MIKHKKSQLILLILFFVSTITGCSSIVNKTVVNRKNINLPLDKKYAISSFWNYTETPMAGLRASTIVEGVLAQKNITAISLIGGGDEIAISTTKKSFLTKKIKEAKTVGADYLIIGNVQEWRYKTGIDGEPVVSYGIKIINLQDNSTVFNGVGAKSAWGSKSIGVVAQEIAKDLIPTFVK